MKIIYNIEDFVITQMFRPYQNIIVADPTPENIKECEKELRKHPENIIHILNNNKQAYNFVYSRLAKIDFRFYKWLQHPLIKEVCSIVVAFRQAENFSKINFILKDFNIPKK